VRGRRCRVHPRQGRRAALERLDLNGPGWATSETFEDGEAKACRALGIPLFSPHDLRHRRISLLDRQGRTWAEIGAFVGQRSARVTSDVYTHVLLDDREVDYRALLNGNL
jgi:integrase